MLLPHISRRSAIISATILSACCRSPVQALAADTVTTQPAKIAVKIVENKLVLSQRILEATEKAVGATAIPGLEMTVHGLKWVDEKPAGIIKEPKYMGKPMYGAFRIGDGPKNLTYAVIDEAPGFPGKIYVDKNQNGDLTDDGSGEWDMEFFKYGHRNWETAITVHASWGTPVEEKEAGEYTLCIAKAEGLKSFGYYRMTGRSGSLTLGDKAYPIVLGENTADGIFTVPADGDFTRQPVILYIDIEAGVPLDAPRPKVDPTVKHAYRKFLIGHPFEVDGHWYAVRPNISGSILKSMEVAAPDAPPATQPASKVAVGSVAPAFTVERPDGKPLSLADYKGKLVILDFWATWCVPCQASMPGLEKLYQSVKTQDVVVLSVNVLDAKKPFDAWMAKHANTDYHFDFAFDPAGKGDTSVATATYSVYAIPAMFVIGRDGKIAANIVGLDENDGELKTALKAQGIKLPPQ